MNQNLVSELKVGDIYIYIYIYLFIFIFIYLFIYLFTYLIYLIYLFVVAKIFGHMCVTMAYLVDHPKSRGQE